MKASNQVPGRLELYLHIPFCVRKCEYCDFLSAPAADQTIERYLDALLGELEGRSAECSGYVVDTLEAALWCLLNTEDYSSCILRAVNLGEDTDTVAAVAGGLAGIYYGLGGILESWRDTLRNKEAIEDIAKRSNRRLYKNDNV